MVNGEVPHCAVLVALCFWTVADSAYPALRREEHLIVLLGQVEVGFEKVLPT